MQIRLMGLLVGGAMLGALALNASADVAQPTPKRALLALSKTDHTLAIVNPANLQVVAKVPVGADPHEVVASTDGNLAYVSNTGSGKFHEIDVIDLLGQKARGGIDTGALTGPHGLAFVDDKVWFTAQGAKSIGRYNPAESKIDWMIGTGQDRTHMLVVSRDAKKIYATNVDSGTMSVFENVLLPPTVTPMGYVLPGAKPYMDWVQTIVPVAKGSEGLDVSPDGKELWTAAPTDGVVSIIDTDSKKVAATIDAKILGAIRVSFTPDGKRVLISSLKTGDVFVYDVATRKEIKHLNVGHGASSLLMDEIGGRVFVSCTPDNNIAVIDLITLEVTGRIDVWGRPDGLAWAVSK